MWHEVQGTFELLDETVLCLTQGSGREEGIQVGFRLGFGVEYQHSFRPRCFQQALVGSDQHEIIAVGAQLSGEV